RLRAGSLVAGRCFETDVKRPYAPWAEALSAVNQLGVGGGQVWKELPRLVPELGAAAGAVAQHKYVLFDEAVAYLRMASASRPIVVVLDDMQWADTASWDLLEHVVSSLERDRILICLTVRAEDAERSVVERMRRLSRDERYSEISLKRLTEREVAVWLDHVFAHQDIDPAILPLLQRYSEGNPFLTTQILRTLLDDKLIQFNSGRWELRSRGDIQLPAAVAGLMERRLEKLSPDTRRILATAAVIGRVFDIDLASAAGAGTEDELLDAIDEGTAHAVLEAVGTGGSTYSFTHSLLVNAVASAVNARRLSRIHERVAQALEEHAPTRLAEIAVHYDKAGNPEKTYTYAMAAGRSSTAVYAHSEARSFFALAANSKGVEESQRATAMFHLAEVAETEGKAQDANRLCEEILEDLGERASAGQYLALRRMHARIRALLGRPTMETIDECQSLLLEAITIGDRSEEAALLGMISHAHGRLGNNDEAEAVARQAANAARAMGESRTLADALNRLGTTVMTRSPEEALDHYQQAIDLYKRLDDRIGQSRSSINMGIIYVGMDNGVEAERAYMRGLDGARSAHAQDLSGAACINLGVLYLKRGRTELASERFEEALKAFESTQGPYRLFTLLNLAHLARENGQWDRATELYTEVIALAVHTGQPDVELGARAGAALTELSLGHTAAAADQSRAINARLHGRPGWWFQGREIVEALRIRIAAVRKDYGEAISLLKENVEALQTRDLYAAGWLLGECASALPPDRVPFQLINELGPRIESLGYAGLALRIATLRLILNDGPRPSSGAAPRWAPTGSEYESPTVGYTPPPPPPTSATKEQPT
ncbi:MAG: tetratricopeptide repeat protein, partial [Gemmatimonadaceae bacterium]